MGRLTKIVAAGSAITVLGLTIAACQPQEMAPPALEAAAGAEYMTVAEVEKLIVVGNTVLARDEARKISRTEYFSQMEQWN